MPKINQEEYEMLKDLDDNWKWIARDNDNTPWIYTKKPRKDTWGRWQIKGILATRVDINLFQFIQWEDEDPYSIAELIEEYEDSKEYKDSLVIEYFMDKVKESEEKEVKKDIEWLKEETSAVLREVFNNHALNYVDYIEVKRQLERLFGQLDEPEVLSQKWMDENKSLINGRSTNPDGTEGDCYDAHYIHVLELQNLLVPKQEELTDEQIARKVDQAYKDGYEKGKEHATEKERETVGSVFVDFLLASAKLKLALAMEVEELEE